MTDERVDITVTDKVSPQPAKKLRDIAKASLAADAGLSQLDTTIRRMDASALTRLAAASAQVSAAQTRDTTTQARLSAERTRAVAADNATALAVARVTTERLRGEAAAQRAVSASARARAATLAEENASLRLAAARRREAAATDRSAGAARRSAGANRAAGGAQRQLRGQVQNSAFQMQDMVVQLQAGTDWTIIMAQQVPQLAGGFGALGAVIGVVAAVGFAGLGVAMKAAGRDTRDFQERFEDLETAMGEYTDAAKLADMSTEDLSERFGSAATRIQSTLDLLELIAQNDAQRAIDDLSESISDLYGVTGGGDRRFALADLFDVNIGLAFTDVQREARSQARQLTAEFVRQQDALVTAEGSIEDQITALRSMLNVAETLADVSGGRSAEEDALIKKLASSLVLMEDQRGSVEENRDMAISLVDVVRGLDAAFDTATTAADRTLTKLVGMRDTAADVIRNMKVAAIAASVSQQGRGAAGPGGPSTVAELFEASTGGIFITQDKETAPTRGGGSSRSGPTAEDLAEDLQAVKDASAALDQTLLAGVDVFAASVNEQKAIQAERLATNKEALDARVISEQDAADRIVAINKQAAMDVQDIEAARNSMILSAGQDTFASLADAAMAYADNQSGLYKAMFVASKAFAIADSIMKIQQGIANAMALPFPANLAAGATVAASAASIVSNIKAVQFKRDGGEIFGPGGPRDDKVPVMASNGEFMVNARDAQRNKALLRAINSGQDVSRRFRDGGEVGAPAYRAPPRVGSSTGGNVQVSSSFNVVTRDPQTRVEQTRSQRGASLAREMNRAQRNL